MGERLNAPLWKQDAFTLRRLQVAIERILNDLDEDGTLPGVVVDMGAGGAPYCRLFQARGATYVSCDICNGPGIDVVLENGRAVELGNGFADCVVSFQVLEHVWDIDAYLLECRRLLSADGKLLLSTHGTWLYHPHPTDFRRWTRDGLLKEIESRGYIIDSIIPVVGPLAWTSQFRCLAYSHLFQKFGVLGRFFARVSNALFYLRMVAEDFVTPPALKDSNAAIYVVVASKA
ncbi:Methyltransferase domain-containing protein [Microbulbifer donghaiensis]|uniref:Methyltransferase domain-containing protein n=1 Tax=Microbulbifer donghaiensis TaxID=494016 RepID=A0A1M4XQ43_9GAMM|nr:class I SAM-dependent methyltransferase [Microbulbifer donghaiensis]SHE95707.1 Methyltransferase domain-containing protein [Microbulbifer donghaiensis]